MMKTFVIPLLLYLCTGAVSLPHYNNFQEEACSARGIQPLKNFNRKFVDSLTYIPGGCKYELFRIASFHPRYPTITDDEFYYDFCVRRNISSATRQARLTGFGRTLIDLNLRRIPNRPEVYFDLIPDNPLSPQYYLRAHVVLTDNKTFALLVVCWNYEDVSTWLVVSKTPRLEAKTRKLVEDHVGALGFKKEYFIFHRYDACNKSTLCSKN